MEKYFLFLKKPFSFHGRFNKIQYLISLLITTIFSFISILIILLLLEVLHVYQKPESFYLAETDMKNAENEYNNRNNNPDLPHEINKNKRLKRDKETAETIYSEELVNYYNYLNNTENLITLFFIILNIPLALFLIASGTKRSHDIGDSGILQIALPIYIWVLLFKNSEKSDNLYGEYIFSDIKVMDNKNNIETMVSDICPHCKNPNTKLIRLCEWCGNQIV